MKKLVVIFLFVIIICPVNVFSLNITAKSAIVIDNDTGRILLEKNINEKRLIASTTKIMTFIVAVENGNINDTVKVGEEVLKMYGSNIYLELGEEMTLKDLLYGMMLRSGNDAATVIANYIGGSVEKFVELMNEKAKSIGMNSTIFKNPTGLDDDEENYSTAYDMALLSKMASKNSLYMEVTSTKKYRVDNDKIYIWNNRNEMLKRYQYTTSGKTGYTPKAGHTLVSTASYNNLNLTAVSLNDNDMYVDQENMYDYVYSNYEKITILDKNKFYIDNNYYKDHVYIKNSFSYPLTEEEQDKIKTLVSITKKTKLKNGEEVGNVKVYFNDEIIHEEPIFVEIKKKKSFWDFLTNLF